MEIIKPFLSKHLPVAMSTLFQVTIFIIWSGANVSTIMVVHTVSYILASCHLAIKLTNLSLDSLFFIGHSACDQLFITTLLASDK